MIGAVEGDREDDEVGAAARGLDELPAEADAIVPPDVPQDKDPGSGRLNVGHRWRWPKGVSGNPHGNARRKWLTDDLVRQLGELVPGDARKRTIAEMLNRALIAQALRGNVLAQREVRDRTEGRVPLTVKLAPEVEEESRTDLVITVIDTPARPVEPARPAEALEEAKAVEEKTAP